MTRAAPPRWSELTAIVDGPQRLALRAFGAPLYGALLVGDRLPPAIAAILSTIAPVLPPVAAIFTGIDSILDPITQTTNVPRVPSIFPAVGAILASVRPVFQSIADVLNPVSLVRVWRLGQRRGGWCRGQQQDGNGDSEYSSHALLPQSRRWESDGDIRRGVVAEPTCHGIFTGPPYRVLPIQNLQRSLLYHDAVGAARFAIAAPNKALLDPGLSPPVAVILGLMTGIGGGLLRDVLAGRPTLLMSRETYASPIVSGCSTFVTLSELTPDFQHAAAVGTTLIIGVRALAIWFHLEMPGWLVKRD